jgi:hypothetical protein
MHHMMALPRENYLKHISKIFMVMNKFWFFNFESVKIMVNQGTDNLQSRGQSPLKLVYSMMNLQTTGCQTQPKPWIR